MCNPIARQLTKVAYTAGIFSITFSYKVSFEATKSITLLVYNLHLSPENVTSTLIFFRSLCFAGDLIAEMSAEYMVKRMKWLG